ncbi:MAG: Asp-tRNA(Asn)/Glu-tRNA(Gln) amidotransferase subunit GatA [Clostridia bacterium]|nr:Asp-tRNA(Asn)/Glu-tRNA(Gln) amidotransferase subunit GatA [Clostridia bacterium]
MEYCDLTLIEIRDGIKNGQFSSEEVVKYFIARCEEKKSLNAMIEVFDDVLEKAKEVDAKIAKGEKVGILAGVPVAIKDNILCKGKKMACASKFLQNFVAPYSSTVVEKLVAEDAIIFGRTNMDEFAMGGSCENTCYGACHNAINPEYVAGGSSGGSAAAVAAGLVPCALGTDTGGSIRQPASFNGVVGVKPTYGTVSRYGIVAFASSLDQASPIAKTASDCELVLKVLAGKDANDSTTIDNKLTGVHKSKYKLGVCRQVMQAFKDSPCREKFYAMLEKLNDTFDIVQVDIPHIQNSLACYYIIAPAEATSNLARFDGVKYTTRADDTSDLESVYVKSRSEGFGKEVKRRIMLGNYVLSSGYFDAYYNKAKAVQKLIRREFKTAFENCDCIIMPTTSGSAFKIGEKISDPVAMYKEDLFTVPANIVGVPAISVPYGVAENGLPLGVQFYADEQNEAVMFEIAKMFEKVGGAK